MKMPNFSQLKRILLLFLIAAIVSSAVTIVSNIILGNDDLLKGFMSIGIGTLIAVIVVSAMPKKL